MRFGKQASLQFVQVSEGSFCFEEKELATDPSQAHHPFAIEYGNDDCELSEKVNGLWHQGSYGILPAVAFRLGRAPGASR